MKSLIFLFAISIFISSCNTKEESEEPTENKPRVISESILDFANKYNAIVGWDTLNIFATVQFEELILNKKRPILIENKYMWFGDIYYTNESYHFKFSVLADQLGEYYFDLECNNSQKEEILNKVRLGIYLDIIAIAEIQSVKKISHIIESELEEKNSESIDLNLGYSNDFIIEGKLIELLNK